MRPIFLIFIITTTFHELTFSSDTSRSWFLAVLTDSRVASAAAGAVAGAAITYLLIEKKVLIEKFKRLIIKKDSRFVINILNDELLLQDSKIDCLATAYEDLIMDAKLKKEENLLILKNHNKDLKRYEEEITQLKLRLQSATAVDSSAGNAGGITDAAVPFINPPTNFVSKVSTDSRKVTASDSVGAAAAATSFNNSDLPNASAIAPYNKLNRHT